MPSRTGRSMSTAWTSARLPSCTTPSRGRAHDQGRARGVPVGDRARPGGRREHRAEAIHALARVTRAMRSNGLLLMLAVCTPAVAGAQAVPAPQNTTLRAAIQASENLDF